MQEMLQPKGFVKGLSAFYLMGPPDYVDEFWGVVYRPKSSHPGVMIGICPWCGADYLAHIEAMEKKSAPRTAKRTERRA